MKLRTGTPVWLPAHPPKVRATPLRKSVSCDVAVIGAGITGALVAHELLQAGLDVAVFDRRNAGYGSTAASTGLLLYQPDSSIGDLTRRHHRRTAQRAFQLGRQAIRELRALTQRLHIDCGWKARRTLYVASRPSDAEFIRDEAKRTRQIGFAVKLLERDELLRRFGLPFANALLATGSAEVNAFALTVGVMRHCLRQKRFRLFQGTHVSSIREQAHGVELRTATGHRVRARTVIVAPGYEAGAFVHSRLIKLRSTYVIASPRMPARQLKGLDYLMWETARPYFYLRTTSDRRILFGGLDDAFAGAKRRDRKLETKTRELEAMFAGLFPALAFRSEFAWTGTFAETTDGLPCIGPIRSGSRVLFALGYGGNGITFSQIAAKILRDACLGRRNADAALFGFDRQGRRQRRYAVAKPLKRRSPRRTRR